jgi:replicative DNA helicase
MITNEFTSELTAEQALIGSLLLAPGHLPLIADEVSAADFVHDPDLGSLFEAMGILADAGVPLCDLTVSVPQFRSMGVPADVCSAACLARLITNSFGHHARHYAQAVRRASRIRQLERIATELHTFAARSDADPDQIERWLEAATRTMGHSVSSCRHLRDIAADVVAKLKDPSRRQHPVMSGLYSLDEGIGGFCGGELIVLAARPGVGKTALAMQIAMCAAERGTVLYFSLEMEQTELVERILASAADVNSRRLRMQRADDAEIRRIVEAADTEGATHDLYVDDAAGSSIQHIRATAKHLSAKGSLRFVVVDYLGLIERVDNRVKDWEHIADCTRALKKLAKELSIPVLVLSQLKREADNGEPRLSDLARSSSIEADADLVVFIHQSSETERSLMVAKNRHGDTGAFPVTWIPNRTRFEDGPKKFSELG